MKKLATPSNRLGDPVQYPGFFRGILRSALMAALFLVAAAVANASSTLTLNATADGDANYAWNSKYGPYGYTTGGTNLGVGLGMGGSYGNDCTIGIIEIPIAELESDTLLSANLKVYSNGFSTGYYYGSAGLWWIAPSVTPTGNPVTDGIGSMVGGVSIEYLLWDGSQGPGWYTFDVSDHVQADLAAGRSYSTFILGGSRDTGGSIAAAESSNGPQIEAVTAVPEPSVFGILASGLIALGVLRRKRN